MKIGSIVKLQKKKAMGYITNLTHENSGCYCLHCRDDKCDSIGTLFKFETHEPSSGEILKDYVDYTSIVFLMCCSNSFGSRFFKSSINSISSVLIE